MAVQTTVAIGTVTTGTILPGAGTRCEVPTACDDLYTVQAPLSEEEIRRLGVPGPVYMVESVSLAKIKLLDAVKYLAESGQLHTEMVGMNLQSCAGALVQVKLWVDAGKAAGQPYDWETVGAALVPVLARALEREPTEEEVEEILKPMKLDIGAIMTKVGPPPLAQEQRGVDVEKVK